MKTTQVSVKFMLKNEPDNKFRMKKNWLYACHFLVNLVESQFFRCSDHPVASVFYLFILYCIKISAYRGKKCEMDDIF